jgi:hypothetical protein
LEDVSELDTPEDSAELSVATLCWQAENKKQIRTRKTRIVLIEIIGRFIWRPPPYILTV